MQFLGPSLGLEIVLLDYFLVSFPPFEGFLADNQFVLVIRAKPKSRYLNITNDVLEDVGSFLMNSSGNFICSRGSKVTLMRMEMRILSDMVREL